MQIDLSDSIFLMKKYGEVRRVRMTQDGQFELTDFLSKKIESKSVMDLTAWINSQGKAQYTQIDEVVRNAYNLNKDSDELISRLTNAVSVYVLNQSMGYMDYLRKESEL